MHWTPSDNIVLARGEFPANVYPRLNQAPKGVEINWGEAKPGRLSTADFAKVVNRKMRVLSVSSVQFFDGYVAPYGPDLPCVKTTAFSLSSTQFKALEYFHLMSRKRVSTCSAPMGTSAATDFLVAHGIDTISKRVLMRTDRRCRG